MKRSIFSWVLVGAFALAGVALVGCSKTKEGTDAGTEVPSDKNLFSVNGVEFRMVPVEGGTFMMGASPKEEEFVYGNLSKPAHEVTLSSFSIAETEVTRELWEAVMGEELPPREDLGPQHPVHKVSLERILTAFLPKLKELTGRDFTVPTEAQWEFAARGGVKSKGFLYSGSDDCNEVASYMYSGDNICPVKAFLPNELGLYDMSGNVFEFCRSYLGAYTTDPMTDPELPADAEVYTVRGGGYSSLAEQVLVCARIGEVSLSNKAGFRLALKD